MCSHTHDLRISFSDDKNACNFWWVPLQADLDISSNRAEMFSIGFGLFIWAITGMLLMMAELSITLELDKEFENQGEAAQCTSQIVALISVFVV
jgi:hypothetical protein